MTAVKPFVQQACIHLLNCDFFYPSNKELTSVTAHSSIRDTLGSRAELFNGKDKPFFPHTIGKPLRTLMRAVAFFAISFFIAPLGVVWNGCKLIQRIVQYLRSSEVSRLEAEGKVIESILAVLADLVCAGIAFTAAKNLKKSLPKFFSERVWSHPTRKFHKLAYRGIEILMNAAVYLLAGVDPRRLLGLMTFNKAERAGLCKTLSLRNDFGLVDENKNLLLFDPQLDDEEYINNNYFRGHLTDIRTEQAGELLFWIQYAQERLPQDRQIPPHYPLDKKCILHHLLLAKQTNKIDEETHDFLHNKFRTVFHNYSMIDGLLNDCLTIKYSEPLEKQTASFYIPFPFDQATCNKAFYFFYAHIEEKDTAEKVSILNRVRSAFAHFCLRSFNINYFLSDKEKENMDAFQAFLAKATLSSQGSPNISPEHLALYQKIKSAVKTRVSANEAYKILGLDRKPATEKELRVQYRKCVTIIHPDKHEQIFKEEATSLFKCVQKAFEHLTKS